MNKNDTLKSIDILRSYQGKNPYIKMLSKQFQTEGNSILNNFTVEYITKNYDKEPKEINKAVKLADWLAEKKKEDWGIDFLPTTISIKYLLGETSTTYHCYIKYRKNMEMKQAFLSKKGVLNNFLVSDYHNLNVDFDRYDRLSSSKEPGHVLKEHQKEAVKFLLSRKQCVLADDMGLGKTKELAVAAIEGNFDSVIIICPASLKTNWKKELLYYVPERDITIIDSFANKNKSELEALLGYGVDKSGMSKTELLDEAKTRTKWQDNRFVIVNFDIIDEFYKIPVSRSSENISKALAESPMLQYIKDKKSLIIIDEAHKLSNGTSIRYKVIKDLIKRGKPDSIYAATGTPITNNPKNFYYVLSLLDDPITSDYNYYINRYCDAFEVPAKGEKEKYYPLWKKEGMPGGFREYLREHAKMITVSNGASNLEELKERVSHLYLRRTKEDLTKSLPKKTIHEIFYDFNIIQEMEYAKLWEEYERAQLEIDPTKEINKDLLEGAVYRKYCSNEMIPNTTKLADEFIANGDKVVIFCCYDEELYRIKDYYGDKCVIYNGKMSAKQKDKAVKLFTEDDNIMVFIGNIQAAGVGITLVKANKLIFNNISFVSGDNSQCCDRIYRIGQEKDVDIYYQFFRGTQYEKMWNIVLRKQLVIDSVITKEGEKTKK